jgi:hypothetical protein
MTIEQMRNAARKTITSTKTEMAYVIRKLCHLDYLHNSAELGLEVKTKYNGTTPPPEADQIAYEKFVRFVLGQGVVSPKVFFGEEKATPDGEINSAWLGDDAGWLFSQIQELSGLGEKGQQALEAISKNETKREESTSSVALTDASQASS